jgi:hypothetical protein
MTTALHYTYITGTPAAIQQAWTDFARDGEPPASQDRDVHFIPAMGGCFVVLQEPEAPSTPALAPFAWLMPSKGSNLEEALERFKLRFETR